MTLDRAACRLAILITVAAIGALAGCGSDDDAASSTATAAVSAADTMAAAKATLSKDCQQGKAEDKPLCDCIADELEKAGNDADQILALNKLVNGGTSAPAVTKAAKACSEFAAG